MTVALTKKVERATTLMMGGKQALVALLPADPAHNLPERISFRGKGNRKTVTINLHEILDFDELRPAQPAAAVPSAPPPAPPAFDEDDDSDEILGAIYDEPVEEDEE